jgi:hypothetical protein
LSHPQIDLAPSWKNAFSLRENEIEIEIETRSGIAARDRPLVKRAACASRLQLREFHGSMSLNNVSAILSPPPSLSGNETRRWW